MSTSVNLVVLIGHLGADPEVKTLPGGAKFARLRLATTETWTDRATNERKERTDWHTLVAWEKLAEICEKYMTKGKLVYVQGKLQTRTWDDKDSGQKRYATEIKCDVVRMLGGRTTEEAGAPAAKPAGQPTLPLDDDDVPF